MKRKNLLFIIIIIFACVFGLFACKQEPEKIQIEKITFAYPEFSMEFGQSRTLSTIIRPINATERNLEWSSSALDVVIVEDGVVSAVGVGQATVSVWADNGQIVTCDITVTNPKTQNKEVEVGVSIEGQIDHYLYTSVEQDYKIDFPQDIIDIQQDNSRPFYFEGWYLDEEFTTPLTENVAFTQDTTIYAHLLDANVLPQYRFSYTVVGDYVQINEFKVVYGEEDSTCFVIPSTLNNKPVKVVKSLFNPGYYINGYWEDVKYFVISEGIEIIENESIPTNHAKVVDVPSSLRYFCVDEQKNYLQSFTQLEEFKVDKDNESFATLDGDLFSKDYTKLYYVAHHDESTYTVPDAVTTIYTYAFLYSGVSEIKIGSGVKEIQYYALIGSGDAEIDSIYCQSLEQWLSIDFGGAGVSSSTSGQGRFLYINDDIVTSVVIPSTVAEIKPYTFSGFSEITDITIPSTVAKIDGTLIAETKIPTFHVEDLESWCNTEVIYENGVRVLKEGKSLCVGSQKVENLIIPSTVTEIKSGLFANFAFNNLTLHSSINKIGNYAFFGSQIGTDVTIPSSVISIGDYVFSRSSLINVTFEANSTLTSIGERAFANSNIEEISFPNSVLEMGEGVFYENKNLKSVDLSSQITVLPKNLFYMCDKLEGVVISQTVTEIGESAFYNCLQLKSIEIPQGVTVISNRVFGGCSALKSVVLPEGLLEIKEYAFSRCSQLKSIVLPEGLVKIGESAFSRCNNLESVTIPSTVTTIEGYAFAECYKITEIYIPSSVTTMGTKVFNLIDSITIYSGSVSQPSGWNYAWSKSQTENSGLYAKAVVVWAGSEIADDGYIYTVVDGVRYKIKDGEATVALQSKVSEEIIIKPTIQYKEQTYPVTGIEFAACSGEKLRSVVIPASITKVTEGCIVSNAPKVTIYLNSGVDTSLWSAKWNYYNYPVIYNYDM